MVWSLSGKGRTRAYFARTLPPSLFELWRTRRRLGIVARKKHAILRNEPISFSRTSRCIHFIYRSLCRLQRRLQMGSFSKNEPILGVLIGGPDAAETKTNPSPPSSFALSADKTAGRLASTEGRLMTGQTRCVFYHGRGVGAPPCEERSYETYRY